MSRKNNTVANIAMASPDFVPYLVYSHNISHLEGKILTIIETLGLRESQEQAVKGLLRQAVWSLTVEAQSLTGASADKAREESNVAFNNGEASVIPSR